jgi:hypothetical protein
MTEQNLTTDADEFDEIDDTEGHVRARNADEDANEIDDVEGHGRYTPSEDDADDAEDDTEGHMRH